MQLWGKVLGFIFGYMFARIPGAIIGVIIGHMFDRGYARAFDRIGGFASLFDDKNSLRSRALFFHTLFSIMGHIAKSSGRVTEADIKLASRLMERLGLTGELKQEAQAAYREGKQADFPIKQTVKEFKQFCSGRREFIQMYLEIQIQAALVNGELNSKAAEILATIAKILGFTQNELDKLIEQVIAMNHFHQQEEQRQREQQKQSQQQSKQWHDQAQSAEQPHSQRARNDRQHHSNSSSHSHSNSHSRSQSSWQRNNQQQQLQTAYRVIGITSSATEKEGKKAYKKLMAQHHPDKLVSQGLPEQALELAKEKTQDIQAAWQLIKEQHGWK